MWCKRKTDHNFFMSCDNLPVQFLNKPMHESSLFIGCAGWSVPKAYADEFSLTGSQLERYASRLRAVEINSSFYRPHQPKTYARWAASVPHDFQFAVKAPKLITHEQRLREIDEPLKRFLGEVTSLGAKLGPLLFQFPPSLPFEPGVAKEFFNHLRQNFEGQVVCEPRHRSWFTLESEELLHEFKIARVAADPALLTQAGEPGGWNGLIYYRLHGSPQMYYSAYSPEYLEALSQTLFASATNSVTTWCIFDNTAEFAAMGNALAVVKSIEK